MIRVILPPIAVDPAYAPMRERWARLGLIPATVEIKGYYTCCDAFDRWASERPAVPYFPELAASVLTSCPWCGVEWRGL